MNAMEKMVANMIGVTPQQMGEMVTGFQSLLKNLAEQLNRIEAKLDALEGDKCRTDK